MADEVRCAVGGEHVRKLILPEEFILDQFHGQICEQGVAVRHHPDQGSFLRRLKEENSCAAEPCLPEIHLFRRVPDREQGVHRLFCR